MGLMTPSSAQAAVEQEQLPPRYNIAPSQAAPVVVVDRSGGGWRVEMLAWGLVPAWATESEGPGARRPINARSETAASSPMFRGPMRTRRCVVPASGFFEWQARGGPDAKRIPKQPWYITPAGDGGGGMELFAMAGVWDEWRPRESAGGEAGSPLRTFAILTTAANDAMKPVHDRMPVMLSREGVAAWLDAGVEDAATLAPLLRPCADPLLQMRRVGTWVNSPGHDDARCIEEAPEQPDVAQASTRRRVRPESPGLFE